MHHVWVTNGPGSLRKFGGIEAVALVRGTHPTYHGASSCNGSFHHPLDYPKRV